MSLLGDTLSWFFGGGDQNEIATDEANPFWFDFSEPEPEPPQQEMRATAAGGDASSPPDDWFTTDLFTIPDSFDYNDFTRKDSFSCDFAQQPDPNSATAPPPPPPFSAAGPSSQPHVSFQWLMGETGAKEAESPLHAEHSKEQDAHIINGSLEAVGQEVTPPRVNADSAPATTNIDTIMHDTAELQTVEQHVSDFGLPNDKLVYTNFNNLPLNGEVSAADIMNAHTNNLLQPSALEPGYIHSDELGVDTINPDELGADPNESMNVKSAFAKLVFPDGDFFMTTYSIELGRTERLKMPERRSRYKNEKRHSRSESDPPKTPKRRKTEQAGSIQQSLMSDGGIIPPSGWDHEGKSRASHRSDSPTANPNDLLNTPRFDYNSAAISTLPIDAAPRPLDPSQLLPNPDVCVKVPIHPRNAHTGEAGGIKSISRSHAYIKYNFESAKFDLQVKGRNGVYVNTNHHPAGSTVVLEHMDELQIGGVDCQFLLPRIPDNVSQSDDGSAESSGMVFHFENSRGESIAATGDGSDSEQDEAFYGSEWLDPTLNATPSDDDSDSMDVEEDRRPYAPKKSKQPTKKILLKLSKNKASKNNSTQALKAEKHGIGKKKSKTEPTKTPATKTTPKSTSLPKSKAKATPKPVQKDSDKKNNKIVAQPDTQPTIKEESPEVKKEKGKEPAKTDTSHEFKAIAYENDVEGGRKLDEEEAKKLGVNPDLKYLRKKGPGRPPKDGVMSKREKALLMKQAKEREKALREGRNPEDVTVSMSTPKPASRPRKDSDVLGDANGVIGEGSSQAQIQQRPSKVERPERELSPEPKETDYTEEQLQKPTQNYVQLIFEVISESPEGHLPLQQIYKAIERKYPYFKFRVQTNGWQSSVRHNLLSGGPFLRKNGGNGKKDTQWEIDPTKSIEKPQRKRAVSPPPPPPQQQQQQSQHSYYPQHPQRPQMPQYMQQPPRPNMNPYPHSSQPQNAGAQPVPAPRIPSSLRPPGAAQNPVNNQRQATYVSPWAQGPSPPGGAAAGPPASPYGPSPSHQSPYGPPASPYGSTGSAPQINRTSQTPRPPPAITPPSMSLSNGTTPVQGPAQTPAPAPAHNTTPAPAHNTNPAPAQNPVSAPVQNPISAPAQNPAPAPTQGADQTPRSHTPPGPAPAHVALLQNAAPRLPQAMNGVASPSPDIPSAIRSANDGPSPNLASQPPPPPTTQQQGVPPTQNPPTQASQPSQSLPPQGSQPPTQVTTHPGPPPISHSMPPHMSIANATGTSSSATQVQSPMRPDVEPLTPPATTPFRKDQLSRPSTAGGENNVPAGISPSGLRKQLEAVGSIGDTANGEKKPISDAAPSQ